MKPKQKTKTRTKHAHNFLETDIVDDLVRSITHGLIYFY